MHEIKKNGTFTLADHGSDIRKNGRSKLASHDHETNEIKKSGSSKLTNHDSSTACDDTSVADRHIGKANKASK